jgi:hypothetical protein
MASLKEEVSKITIVEQDEELIAVFNQYLLPQFAKKEKIEIIPADAFAFAKETMPKSNYDCAFVDLWRSVDDGLPLYLKMKQLEKGISKTRFAYWIEASLLAMVRRVVITILQENLEGYQEADYQKEDAKEDRLFKEIYHLLPNIELRTIDDVLGLLSDESLRTIIGN